MSSRQEEKERRKAQRLRQEAEAAAREKRRRIMQIAAVALVAAVVVAGAVLVAAAGDDKDASNATSGPAAVPVPARRTEDLDEAVKAAGCKLGKFPNEGQVHVEESKNVSYKTNPPTSGDHFQNPAQDGVYVPGNPPQTGNWIHSLEHGRVLFQYRKGTPARRVGQLETLFNESYAGGGAGYHTLLLENTSQMPFAVAAVAWTRYVGCERFTDRAFDALRAFRADAVDKAPEQVP